MKTKPRFLIYALIGLVFGVGDYLAVTIPHLSRTRSFLHAPVLPVVLYYDNQGTQ